MPRKTVMTNKTSLSSKTPGMGKFIVKRKVVSTVVLMIMRAIDADAIRPKIPQTFLNQREKLIIFECASSHGAAGLVLLSVAKTKRMECHPGNGFPSQPRLSPQWGERIKRGGQSSVAPDLYDWVTGYFFPYFAM
jgi:hypothetical protein